MDLETHINEKLFVDEFMWLLDLINIVEVMLSEFRSVNEPHV